MASLGEAGRAWAEGLPGVLAELAEQWGLTLGRALPGGSASYVVSATTRDGAPRVVKLVLADPDLADESRTLVAAEGRGYAHLFDHDVERGALLLEALGPSLDRAVLPVERKLEILARTLAEAWTVPLGTAPVLAPGEDKGSTLHQMVVDLDARHPGACDPEVLAQALAYAEARAAAHDPDACVVVHGDAHAANALRVDVPRPGAASGYVFVDPDGFRADPAYDLGVTLRDWKVTDDRPRAELERLCALLAGQAGSDEQRVWEWAFLERVSTGLYVTDFGAESMGRWFLESAARLLRTR
ncbi:aminoglycoside phosphotransferase family protein [Nocardioides luti]|uniref:aminoglycoside phosphotransferase family protein n=1 Tax=Nocardioides luti TaxID=2761101 RepID=UPI0031B5E2C6